MVLIQVRHSDISRSINALTRMQGMVVLETNEMPKRMAIDYYHLLHANIFSEKYSAGYAKYSDRYAKQKQRGGYPFPGWWKLDRELVNSLSAFKVEGGWMGGVPAGVTNEGRYIAVYGTAGEFTDVRKKQPARPVFKPTMLEYEKGGFATRGVESLKKITAQWR